MFLSDRILLLSLSSVLTVTFDKERLASGSADKTVRVWDIKTGQLLHTLRGHTKGVWCLEFFTQHLLISGSYDSTIRVSLQASFAGVLGRVFGHIRLNFLPKIHILAPVIFKGC